MNSAGYVSKYGKDNNTNDTKANKRDDAKSMDLWMCVISLFSLSIMKYIFQKSPVKLLGNHKYRLAE